MIYRSILTSLSASITFGLSLLFGAQAVAQTTLEFDTRIDAATVLTSINASNLNYSGASLGLRASFSVTSVNRVSTKTSLLYGFSYASSGFNRGNFGWCGNSFDNVDPELVAIINENVSYGMQQVNHLSLPVGVRHTLKQGKKWTIYGQAMLEPMVYIHTKYANHMFNEGHPTSRERSDKAKNVQLAAGLAAGFERALTEAWTVAFRPTLRMHLTDAAKNVEPIEGNAKHATMGIAVALGHSF